MDLRAARWILTRMLRPRPPGPAAPWRPLPPEALAPPEAGLRASWIGHSTALVQTPSLNVLLDPVFAHRAGPLSFAGPDRRTGLPIALADLPRIDAVLLSHDHYDHLDKDAVRRLQDGHAPQFFAPLGVGDLLKRWGARRVAELDWRQYADFGGCRFHCIPAKHFSGRSLSARDTTLWCGWYVQPHDAPPWCYAGDTAYGPFFGEARRLLGPPRLLIAPIGAYAPRWFMEAVHMNPEEAVQAALDMEAEHVLPVHWGAFDLADDPFSEAPARLQTAAAARGISERLHVLAVGEQWSVGG